MQHVRGDWPSIGMDGEMSDKPSLESVAAETRRDYYNSLLEGDTPSRGRPDPKGNPSQGNRAKRRADDKAKRRKAGKERVAATP